jgi:hypothetical protein
MITAGGCGHSRSRRKKETPTASFDDIVSGFYAVLCDSVVECKDDLIKESVADFSHSICQKHPDRPIIVVCDDFPYNFSYYINTVAEERNLIMEHSHRTLQI